ncbi:MAG: hypothetical protein JNJ94_03015 [Chlorobi bacterium]|nr:hypothetical protein [Chlorobiota bacterium]
MAVSEGPQTYGFCLSDVKYFFHCQQVFFLASPFGEKGLQTYSFRLPDVKYFFHCQQVFFLASPFGEKGLQTYGFRLSDVKRFFCAKLLLQLPAFCLLGRRLLALFKELPFDKTAPFVRGRC